MKKNKVLKTPIIMIFVVIVIVILAIIGANNKYINSTKSLCNNINKYKKGNKSFVVYFEPQNSDTNEEIKSPINQLSEDYKELIILQITTDKMDDDCIKKELEITGTYSWFQKDEASMIMYKDGKYVGAYASLNEYNSLENSLLEKKVIKKKEIKEDITLEKFKSAIKTDYIIIIIPDENYRSIVEENSSKSFKDYDYDVVDYKSGEGEKIDKYINQNYKVNNNYPKALYFKNSKIVLEESFYNVVEDYQEFVKNIND